MANVAGKITIKLMTVVVGIPVGIATKEVVTQVWNAMRSKDTPRQPAEKGVQWRDAIGWAVLSAVGVVVADLVTRKGAEELWRTLVGGEPPAQPGTKAQKKAEKAQREAFDVPVETA